MTNLLTFLLFVLLCTDASAGLIQLQLNFDNPSSYTVTQEMRDDGGATTGYDAGLDVLLDTSIILDPNAQIPVIYKELSGINVEYDFVPHSQIDDEYYFEISIENRLGSTLLVDAYLKILAFDLCCKVKSWAAIETSHREHRKLRVRKFEILSVLSALCGSPIFELGDSAVLPSRQACP